MLADVIADLQNRLRGLDMDEDYFMSMRMHRSAVTTDLDTELSHVRHMRSQYERAIEILEAAK